jgi:hypothetical protein
MNAKQIKGLLEKSEETGFVSSIGEKDVLVNVLYKVVTAFHRNPVVAINPPQDTVWPLDKLVVTIRAYLDNPHLVYQAYARCGRDVLWHIGCSGDVSHIRAADAIFGAPALNKTGSVFLPLQ